MAKPVDPRNRTLTLGGQEPPKKAEPGTEQLGPQGHCIRCRRPVAFDTNKSYCGEDYAAWAKLGSKFTYEEAYCHACGNPNPATQARPLCLKCYRARLARETKAGRPAALAKPAEETGGHTPAGLTPPPDHTVEQSAYEELQGPSDGPLHDGLTEQFERGGEPREILRLGKAGEYEVIRQLGKGGMAEVMLARKVGAAGIEIDVAIKKTIPELGDDPRMRQMFIEEAQVIALLQHRNIVRIENFQLVDNTFYLVMELIQGMSVREAVRLAESKGKRFSIAFGCEVAAQVADALYYANERAVGKNGHPLRVVHRDVTPHNVMLSDAGDVKLMDFGIAHSQLDGRERSRTGSIKGKPAYMAPEQIRGEELDGRVDIFALGICLAEILTGKLIFEGNTTEATWSKILFSEAAAIESALGDLPAELRAIILKALEKNRDDRYASGQDFARALRDYLRAQGIAFGADEIAAELRELRSLADLSDRTTAAGKNRSGHARTSAPSGTMRATQVHVGPTRSRLPFIVGGAVVALAVAAVLLIGRTHGQGEPSLKVAEIGIPRAPEPAPAQDDSAKAAGRAARAQTHFDLGEYDQAALEWRESYRLKPAPLVLLRLGETMRQLKRNPEAAEYFAKYLAARPDAPEKERLEQMIRERTAPAEPGKRTRRAAPRPAAPEERVAPTIDPGGTGVQ